MTEIYLHIVARIPAGGTGIPGGTNPPGGNGSRPPGGSGRLRNGLAAAPLAPNATAAAAAAAALKDEPGITPDMALLPDPGIISGFQPAGSDGMEAAGVLPSADINDSPVNVPAVPGQDSNVPPSTTISQRTNPLLSVRCRG